MREIHLQAADFVPGDWLGRLEALGGGGVASFTGLVRGQGGLTELLLDHHPTMTAKQMAAIGDDAWARWPLLGLVIVHRHGALAAGDRIVFVGTASAHRAAALDACAFAIDRLKTDVAFWKRESFADGRRAWVEARAADAAAAGRWRG